MRVVVDVQALQGEPGGLGHLGALVEALALRDAGDDVWLLVNEALPGADQTLRHLESRIPAERIRTFAPPAGGGGGSGAATWRADVAQLLREHVIACLAPDVVLVPDVLGSGPAEAVYSIGRLMDSAPTVALLHAPEPSRGNGGTPRLRLFGTGARERLRKTDRVLTCCAGSASRLRSQLRLKSCESLAEGSEAGDAGMLAERLAGTLAEVAGRAAPRRLPRILGGRKPRLACVSPLPPEPTGIADYCAELLPELARHYEIEVVTDQEKVSDPWIRSRLPIRSVSWFDAHADRYDRILYHVGNSRFHLHMPGLLERHPGVVVLHDVYLGHMLGLDEARFVRALHESHGYDALAHLRAHGPQETIWAYPASYGVVHDAAGVMVHSRYAQELGATWFGKDVAGDWRRVPHLHAIPPRSRRDRARRRVGLGEGEFVVCAFGQLGPTKLNQHLLEAWLASKLSRDARCHLVFVGGNPPCEYTRHLEETIQQSGYADRIRITGYADPRTFRAWLTAADAAVQLRSMSRGESSAAIFDCLVRGVPLIVNAHGSAAELPDEVAIKMPDEFSRDELVTALERLWGDADLRRQLGEVGLAHTRVHHGAEKVAEEYRDTIERLWQEAPRVRERKLIEAVAGLDGSVRTSFDDLVAVSEVATRGRTPRTRQLLVDVTAVAEQDLRTGVQRVVRAQLQQLLEAPPEGYRVEPVALCEAEDRLHYRYARSYTACLAGLGGRGLWDEPVEVRPGDVFFDADLHHHGVIRATEAGLYDSWRRRGVRLHFMVHDLLPLQDPTWFPEGTAERHAHWLRCIARVADGIVCVSASVADELRSWLCDAGVERAPEISHVHHGADIGASFPSRGCPEDAAAVLERLRRRPSFLMVGTVDPRKGHRQALRAFEILWEAGVEANLVIAGQEGWANLPDAQRRSLPRLAQELRWHPEAGERLLWLEDVSDEYLKAIYHASACLLAASEGEGFGLPLIEAAQHGVPIIARRLPVFQEVAGACAHFFEGREPEALAESIREWLRLCERGAHPRSDTVVLPTWEQSVRRLREIIVPREPVARGDRPPESRELGADDRLESLRYLEDTLDLEDGRERGPLSEKELLIHAPARTGTVAIRRALERRLAELGGRRSPQASLLHGHGNLQLVENFRPGAGVTFSDLRSRCIVRDLVRYKERTNGHLRIVTSFRDPLARAVALARRADDSLPDLDARYPEEAFESFRGRLVDLLAEIMDASHPVEEIEPDFLDREKFEVANGYTHVDRGAYEILVLCFERREQWTDAFLTAFGWRGLMLQGEAAFGERTPGGSRAELVRRLELPAELVRRVYFGDHALSRQLRWFYTLEEIDAFYQRALDSYVRKSELEVRRKA